MKYTRILGAVWIAVAVYGIASITIGPSGILAMRELQKEKARLSANMEGLRAINGELEGSIDALRSDADTIAVYARELGYGKADEHFVRIVGVPIAERRVFEAGNLLMAPRPKTPSDQSLRITAIIAGLVAFVLFSFFPNKSSQPRREK